MAIVPLNPKNIASYSASFYEFIGSGYAEGKKFSSSLLPSSVHVAKAS
jgi:hypothetical protein